MSNDEHILMYVHVDYITVIYIQELFTKHQRPTLYGALPASTAVRSL